MSSLYFSAATSRALEPPLFSQADAIIRAMAANTSHRLILASASPRRRRLLRWLGLPYEVTSADVEESLDDPRASTPASLAIHLAEDKARAVRSQDAESVVLAFDTIVVLDDEVLGKPSDRRDARRMLESLSGRTHEVVTGCAILCSGETDPVSFAVTTPVNMRTLAEEDLSRWLASDEPLGCAGAYNIERHLASVELDQCFQNVAGLPLCHLFVEMQTLPGTCLPGQPTSPVAACDSARRVTCALGPHIVTTRGPAERP